MTMKYNQTNNAAFLSTQKISPSGSLFHCGWVGESKGGNQSFLEVLLSIYLYIFIMEKISHAESLNFKPCFLSICCFCPREEISPVESLIFNLFILFQERKSVLLEALIQIYLYFSKGGNQSFF